MNFNRGDTAILMLKDATVNGLPLEDFEFTDLIVQINKKSLENSVTKKYSKGEIEYGTVTYYEDDEEKEWTGYYCILFEEDTFKLFGDIDVQIRIAQGRYTGSNDIQEKGKIGESLNDELIGE